MLKRFIIFLWVILCSATAMSKTLNTCNSMPIEENLKIEKATILTVPSIQDTIKNLQNDTTTKSKQSVLNKLLKSSIRDESKQLKELKNTKNPITYNPDSLIKNKLNVTGYESKLEKLRSVLKQHADSGLFKRMPNSSFGLSLENNSLFQNENPFSSGPSLLNNVSATADLTIAKIPLTLSYSTNSALNFDSRILNNNLFKLNFSPKKFNQFPEGSLSKLSGLKHAIKNADVAGMARERIQSKLKQMGENANASFGNILPTEYLNNSDQIMNLLTLSEPEMKAELVNVATSQLKSIEKNAKDSLNRSKQLAAITMRVDSIVSAIENVKLQLAVFGINAKQLITLEKYLNKEMDIQNLQSEMLNDLAQNNPKSKFMRSVMESIEDLKTGAFGNKIPGGLSSPDVFMKGVHLSSFVKRSGLITLGFGGLNDLSSVKDLNFTNSVFSDPKYLSYVSLKTNHTYFAKGNVSWLSSFSRQTQNILHTNPSLPRNALAITLSEELNVGKLGSLSFDLSKSANQYNRTITPSNELLLERKNALGNYFSSDPVQTLSFGLNHDADFKRWGISDHVYFNYSGVGYQSPAQTGYVTPRMRFGGNIKKSFYGNKVSLNLRTDLKNSPINFTSNDSWKNHQVRLESKYHISRKHKVALSYLSSGMNKKADGINNLVYSSDKLQVDANSNYKIGNLFTVSHLNISQQRLENKYASAASSNFLMVNYIQSAAFKNNTLSVSFLYNKELSEYKLIGDLLNSDVNLSYNLFRVLQSSSSLTYLDNQDIARQVGIRQNFQLLSLKSFDLATSMDIRKNLINPIYPDLYSACRADLMIKYHISNKK